jgi:hypothetical protein
MSVKISSLTLYVVLEASWNIVYILFDGFTLMGAQSKFKMFQHVFITLLLLTLQVYLLKNIQNLTLEYASKSTSVGFWFHF